MPGVQACSVVVRRAVRLSARPFEPCTCAAAGAEKLAPRARDLGPPLPRAAGSAGPYLDDVLVLDGLARLPMPVGNQVEDPAGAVA